MSTSKTDSMPQFGGSTLYIFSGVCILLALLLTFLSLYDLCTEACIEGHKYLLFGWRFEVFGLVFFGTLFGLHLLQKKFHFLKEIEMLLLSSALGAELMFLIIQKYTIGKWCPVCLGIAACVVVAIAAFAIDYIRGLKLSISKSENKEGSMTFLGRGVFNAVAMGIGFFVAFLGVTKFDAMQAKEQAIQDSVAFGKKNSVIEVYLFTDWACPACRKLEPSLHDLVNAVTNNAKFIFVDHVMHPETLNYVPYNLSFILKNKDDYFKLRDMLTEMSEKTGSPTENQITLAAKKLGVSYQELNYSDIAFAIKYYKKLGEKFKIEGTPTIVVINRKTKKGKRLTGIDEITKSNVLKAIESIKK